MLTAIFVLPSSVYAQCSALGTTGLVAHWKLDETSGTTLADSVGTNTGTPSGGMTISTATTAGQIGTAIDMGDTATTHFVDAGNGSEIADIFDGGGTISLWYYARSDGGSNEGILFYKTSNQGTVPEGYDMHHNISGDGKLLFVHNTGGGGNRHHWRTNVLPLNEWVHVVVTYDSSTTGTAANDRPNIYFNGVDAYEGVQFDIGTDGAASSDAAVNLRIGLSNTDGIIDDFRMYDRILSADEVAALYNLRSTADSVAGVMAFEAHNDSLVYCDDTDWRMAGIGSYNPSAVYFDDTNDYLDTSTLTGTPDSDKFTTSFWFKIPTGADENWDGLLYEGNVGGDVQIYLEGCWHTGCSDDLWEVHGRFRSDNTSSNEIIMQIFSDDISEGVWHHALLSFDSSVATGPAIHLYIDDVDAERGVDLTSNSDSDLVEFDGNHAIGGADANDVEVNLADFWVDVGTYIDFSVEANRRKFISPSGMPMYLGEDGSLPTGSQPDIFMSGDTANWHTNKGAGGGFTENGAITTALDQPADSIIASTSSDYLLRSSGTQNISASTSHTYNFGFTGNSGNLLVAAMSWDKAITGLSETGATWTQVAFNSDGANTTVAMYYKISDGTESSISLSWTNSEEMAIWVGEYQGMVTSSVLNQSANTNSGGSVVTSQTSGTTPATTAADAVAIAAFSSDTGKNTDDSRTFTNSFTEVDFQGSASGPGLAIASNELSATGTVETTFSVTDTGDQMAGIMAVFEIDTTSPLPPPPAGTMRYNGAFNVMDYFNGAEWVAMGPVGGTPPTTGLVGHWKLDETSGSTITDSTGTSNGSWVDGENTDVTEEATTGKIDGAIDFDGTQDMVDIPNTVTQEPALFTVAAWVKPEATTPAEVQGIFKSPGGNGFDHGFRIVADYNVAGRVTFRCDDNTSGANNFNVDNVLTAGTWTHLAMTWDGTTLKGFADGVEVGSDNSDACGYVDASNGKIGDADGTEEFNGDIDDVRLYNRALTDLEISQLYNFGQSGGLGDVSNTCTNAGSITGSTAEGIMFYNSDENIMQYCNGEEWIGIGK